MKTNTYLVIGVLVVAVVGAYFLGQHEGGSTVSTTLQNAGTTSVTEAGNTNATAATNPGGTVASALKPAGGTGVAFTLSDDAHTLSALQDITLTLSNVSVYSPAKGWVSVTANPISFDALGQSASGSSKLFANAGLPAGTYTSIRLSIGSVSVQNKNGLPSNAAHLPATLLQMPISLVVVKGQTSGVELNFNSTKSFFKTASNTYVYLPVVTIVAHHKLDKVQTLGGNTQMIGGYTDFTQNWGMDANGLLAINFSYPIFAGTSEFALIGNTIEVLPLGGTDVASVSPQSAIATALQGSYFAAAASIELKMGQTPLVWEVDGFKNGALVHVSVDAKTGAVTAVK